MKKIKIGLNTVLLLLFGFKCLNNFAQDTGNSRVNLQEVEIVSNRLENFSSGTKTFGIDSTSLNQYKTGNLASLLENESPLFIKSYGLGSLATSSFRGGNANHTAILWNGFNLNSPMNGILDLSLVPNSFINNISIQFGGATALWGSGAVGGTIHLSNDVKFDKGISIITGSSIGSFNSYGQNAQIEISMKKWVSSIKIFNNNAENNFEFYNSQLQNNPLQKQSNAELKQYGLLTENYFRISEHKKINACFWYQYNDRNIPPIMLKEQNRSNQKDESYRLTWELQSVQEKTSFQTRMAYLNESIIYSDFSHDYKALSRSQTFIAETESQINLYKNHLLNIGFHNTFSKVSSEDYPDKAQKNRLAAFASYRLNSNDSKFFTTLSARQELIKNILVPFTFSLGAEYNTFKWLSAKGNISKVYRLPTFNELYWVPGGNINLLPESGYSEEAGVVIKLVSSRSKINFSFEPTVFCRNMDNWILWLPGQGYWAAQNIMNVWSRGAETRSELKIQINKLKFNLGFLTNYVLSSNEKVKTLNDASIDKQLIYVPIYSGNGKLSVEYKKLMLSYTQIYKGYRYTLTDNSEYLKPYTLGSIYISYKIDFNKYSLDLFMQINNLYDTQYQAILNRAMPLRNYQAGITIKYHKINN